jgi:hypothetical protein
MNLTTTLLAIAVPVTLLLGLAGMLWAAGKIDQRRSERYARQIALTDAIHGELGAVVAPVLQRGRGGRWLVTMTVPVEQPAIVAAVVRITDQFFASWGDAPLASYEIVLAGAHTTRDSTPMRGRKSSIEQPARVAA